MTNPSVRKVKNQIRLGISSAQSDLNLHLCSVVNLGPKLSSCGQQRLIRLCLCFVMYTWYSHVNVHLMMEVPKSVSCVLMRGKI